MFNKAKYQKAWIRKRLDAGNCRLCNQPRPNPDHQLCDTCRAAATEKDRYYARTNKAKGLCRCGRLPTPPFLTCSTCRSNNRASASKRKRKAETYNLCIQCHQPRDQNTKYCSNCLTIHQQYRDKYRQPKTETGQ